MTRVVEFRQSGRRKEMRHAELSIVDDSCQLCLSNCVPPRNCAKDQDHRSNKTSGLLITDFTTGGTQTLSSDEIARIASTLTGSCFGENSEELEERIRALFLDRGSFGAVVKSFRIKSSDLLAVPKPTTLQAAVLEGPRYKLAEIKFVGNHAFGAADLRSQFPLRKGDL